MNNGDSIPKQYHAIVSKYVAQGARIPVNIQKDFLNFGVTKTDAKESFSERKLL